MTNSAEARSAGGLLQWPARETVACEELGKARREAINLAQWLARVANSFVATDVEEERLMLRFRAADAAFVTGTFAKNLSLEMRLPTLEMQFLENGRPVPHILDPEEHSPAEVEAWLLVELLHRSIDRSKFLMALPYDVPDLMSGDADNHSPQSCLHGLALLREWFCNAVTVLNAAAGAETTRIACQPQNLNLTCRAGSSVAELGFSPGDARNPEPFFYVNSRGEDAAASPNPRAILSASEFLANCDPTEALIGFLRGG
jgi:hypothetical protein